MGRGTQEQEEKEGGRQDDTRSTSRAGWGDGERDTPSRGKVVEDQMAYKSGLVGMMVRVMEFEFEFEFEEGNVTYVEMRLRRAKEVPMMTTAS